VEQEEYQKHLTHMISIKVFATRRDTADRSVPGRGLSLALKAAFVSPFHCNLQQNKRLSLTHSQDTPSARSGPLDIAIIPTIHRENQNKPASFHPVML